MTAPAADSGARRPDGGLRPGVLKVRHAVITSLAVITPAFSLSHSGARHVRVLP